MDSVSRAHKRQVRRAGSDPQARVSEAGDRVVEAGERSISPAGSEHLLAVGRRLRNAESAPPVQLVSTGARIPDKSQWDVVMTEVEGGLKVLEKAIKSYATENREQKQFAQILQDTIAEAAKATAKDAVKTAPFGRALLLTLKLSATFGKAVGAAVLELNERLDREYDTAQLSREHVTERDFELLQRIRRYELRRFQELEGVVLRGLEAVLNELLDDLTEELRTAVGKTLGNVARQFAKQVVRQNELLSIANSALADGLDAIPERRRRVEGLAFMLVLKTGIAQLDDAGLRKRLFDLLPDPKGNETVDVAILASLLSFVVNNAYEKFTRDTPLQTETVVYAIGEVRTVLLEQAFAARQRLGDKVVASSSGAVEVFPDRIAIPEGMLNQLDAPPGRAPSARRNLWVGREESFRALVFGMKLQLEVLARRSELQIARASDKDAAWDRLNSSYVARRNTYRDRVEQASDAIVREFGDVFDPVALQESHKSSIELHLPLGATPIRRP